MPQIATELGIGASGLNLGRASIRTLAGNGGGAIAFSALYGKSNVAPVSGSASDTTETSYSNIRGGSIIGYGTALPSGGNGSYSYSWSITSGNAVLSNASNQTCAVTAGYAKLQNYFRRINLQCIITSAGVSTAVVCTVTLIVDSLQ
jgi:hypothetical protein